MSKTKVLIIGGTGMLSGATRAISINFDETHLLSRRPNVLARDIGARGYSIDWQVKHTVLGVLSELQKSAPFDLLVSWLHEDGIWMLGALEALLRDGKRSVRVHGSAVGDPEEGIKTDPEPTPGILRQNVVLGCMSDSHGQRWLSDEEISDGVIKAFRAPERKSLIVGELPSASRYRQS